MINFDEFRQWKINQYFLIFIRKKIHCIAKLNKETTITFFEVPQGFAINLLFIISFGGKSLIINSLNSRSQFIYYTQKLVNHNFLSTNGKQVLFTLLRGTARLSRICMTLNLSAIFGGQSRIFCRLFVGHP